MVIHKSQKTEYKRRRKRVLMLAYACSPYRGSEAKVGWHRAIETAKYYDTWVICEQTEFENNIRRYFEENGKILGLIFVFIPISRFERSLRKIPGLFYFAYNLWHLRAYHVAVQLQKELKFDLVHQVNMIGFREPGYLWKLRPPFIWGPIGGTQNYPWRFLSHARFTCAIKEVTRSIINMLQLRFSVRVRKAARKAALVLMANSTGMCDFRRITDTKLVLMNETGAIEVLDNLPRRDLKEHTFNILWSGYFVERKALHLLLMALQRIPQSITYELRIVGKGPLEKRWGNLARNLGIAHNCNWAGWLPQQEALTQYKWADVFVFTSLRDTTGSVILESLSSGVPVICLDHQGAADIVTDNCGIKIPVTIPEEVVSHLCNAIVYLSQNREKLKTLSRGALERAQKYLWCQSGERMAGIYSQVLNGGKYVVYDNKRVTHETS